jgi:hypothetical protein
LQRRYGLPKVGGLIVTARPRESARVAARSPMAFVTLSTFRIFGNDGTMIESPFPVLPCESEAA